MCFIQTFDAKTTKINQHSECGTRISVSRATKERGLDLIKEKFSSSTSLPWEGTRRKEIDRVAARVSPGRRSTVG